MKEKYIINGVEIAAASKTQAKRSYEALVKAGTVKPQQHGVEIQRAKRTQPYGS